MRLVSAFSPVASLSAIALRRNASSMRGPTEFTHTYIHTGIRTYRHTYVYTYVQTYLLIAHMPCMHTYMHAYRHTCMNTYMHTCIHAYIHAHTGPDAFALHSYIRGKHAFLTWTAARDNKLHTVCACTRLNAAYSCTKVLAP